MNGEGGMGGGGGGAHCRETHPLNLTGDGIFIWLVSKRCWSFDHWKKYECPLQSSFQKKLMFVLLGS